MSSPEHPVPVASLEALDRIRRMADSEFRPQHRGPRRSLADVRRAEIAYTAARSDPRDPQPLGTNIDALVKTQGWRNNLDVGAVLGRWPDLVGRNVAEHCAPEKFDPPVLVIRASSTTWATQLRILRTQLLDRFERELGRRIIDDIEIIGPVQRSWKHGRRSVRGRGPRDTYG